MSSSAFCPSIRSPYLYCIYSIYVPAVLSEAKVACLSRVCVGTAGPQYGYFWLYHAAVLRHSAFNVPLRVLCVLMTVRVRRLGISKVAYVQVGRHSTDFCLIVVKKMNK